MPEICRFFGIIISFNYRDHPPPHFHVRYGDQKAIVDIVAVAPVRAYRVRITFDDGTTGEIDVSQIVPFEGVFAPLHDLAYFRQVAIHPELATLVWPNGADIDSDVLYHELTGAPLPAIQVA